MSSLVAKAHFDSAAPDQRLAALELWDPSAARAVKRLMKRPVALRNMKVSDAGRYLELMLESGSGKLITAAREAINADGRPSIQKFQDAAFKARVRGDWTEEMTAVTREALESPEPRTFVERFAREAELNAGMLGAWMREHPDNCMAAARIDCAPHADMVLLALADPEAFALDTEAYVQSMPFALREPVLQQVAARYCGPLTRQVAALASMLSVEFALWENISEADDAALLACVDGSWGAAATTGVFALVRIGVLDPWRFVSLNLNVTQRAALCWAAANVGEWDVVNAVLSQGGVYSSARTFAGGDLSNLLFMAGASRMNDRARRECMRYCSASQLVSLSEPRSGVSIEEVVRFVEEVDERYCDDRSLVAHQVRSGVRNEVKLMAALVHGRLAAAALMHASEPVAAILHDELQDMLGDDNKLWRTALSLANGWVGTLDELVTATKALVK